jgi:hypothetical protein
MGDFWRQFTDMLEATAIQRQLLEHDIAGLAVNPWFMVPFCLLILWMIYRKAWRGIVIIALIIGLWWFSGSQFMDGTIVDGKPVLTKLVPVIGVFLVAVAIIAYLLFL